MSNDEHEKAEADRRAQREGDAIDAIADVLSGRAAARAAQRLALETKALIESRWPRDVYGEVIRPGTEGSIHARDFIDSNCQFLAMRDGALRLPEGDEVPCAVLRPGTSAVPGDVVQVLFMGVR